MGMVNDNVLRAILVEWIEEECSIIRCRGLKSKLEMQAESVKIAFS